MFHSNAGDEGRNVYQNVVLGLFDLRPDWQSGSMSPAEMKQLSLFRAYDYEVHSPGHADWLFALLGIRRPVCRCGDPYESHQHYRRGSNCSFCRCERYGPVLLKPSPYGERSARFLRQLHLS
jgi:hypothetical protein